MTALAQQILSRDEARSLTDEVKQDAERLWRKLVELYDGGAHLSLGYSSWPAYFKQEFGGEKSSAYRILDAGRVALALDSPNGGTPPPNERQARELAPLLHEPEKLQDAWHEASENGEPTASKVREVVQHKIRPQRVETEQERQAAIEKQLRWAATLNVLDGLSHFDRPAVPDHADREAVLIDQAVAATRGETVTPERLRRASAWAALLADALERTANA